MRTSSADPSSDLTAPSTNDVAESWPGGRKRRTLRHRPRANGGARAQGRLVIASGRRTLHVMILRPQVTASARHDNPRRGQLPLRDANAGFQAAADIKWPNDVWWRPKICGVSG